jgi:hypothetical protein
MSGPIEERSSDYILSERALRVILVMLLLDLCLSVLFSDYLQVETTVCYSSSFSLVGIADRCLNFNSFLHVLLPDILNFIEFALVLAFVLLAGVDPLL